MVKLLECAIDIGLKCADLSPNFPKLPFFLIEDILDRQTLSHAASTWEIVESLVDRLTLPDLFNRGRRSPSKYNMNISYAHLSL